MGGSQLEVRRSLIQEEVSCRSEGVQLQARTKSAVQEEVNCMPGGGQLQFRRRSAIQEDVSCIQEEVSSSGFQQFRMRSAAGQEEVSCRLGG